MGFEDDEVDPDAATVMPAGRREDAGGAQGPKVAVRAGDEVRAAVLTAVSLTGELTVLADGSFPVDTPVVVRTKGKLKDPAESDGVVIWTRSQGPSVALGIALKDNDTRVWDRLLG